MTDDLPEPEICPVGIATTEKVMSQCADSREFFSHNPRVKALFENDTRIMTVFLHGSRATGNARIDSDVDLGILPARGIHLSSYDRALLAAELSGILPETFDVGEVSSKNLVYAKEVLQKGYAVFERDKEYTAYMTMILLSMYARFNEDRVEVIDAWTA